MIDMDVFSIALIVLTLELLYLSFRRILLRRNTQNGSHISSHRPLMRVIRAYGNFTEYVPITLLLLLVLALYKFNTIVYILYCSLLIIARFIHAYGIFVMERRHPPSMTGRYLGIQLTILTMVIALCTLPVMLIMNLNLT